MVAIGTCQDDLDVVESEMPPPAEWRAVHSAGLAANPRSSPLALLPTLSRALEGMGPDMPELPDVPGVLVGGSETPESKLQNGGLPRPATVRPTRSVQRGRGSSPLSGPWALVHAGWMSMYVELLSAALARGDRGQMNVDAVHASAVMCRSWMLASRMRGDRSAERELATEVDYDRSLINLCRALGIPADSTGFAQPAPERGACLEKALDEAGQDLTSSGGSGSDRTS